MLGALKCLGLGLSDVALALVAALYELRLSAADASPAGAYTAFSCALLVWG